MTSTSIHTLDRRDEERRPLDAAPLQAPPGAAPDDAAVLAAAMDEARSSDPLERLLEDSWESRGQRASRRELILETSAAALFLGVAGPLAASALGSHQVDFGLAVMLVGLYALVAGSIRFPIGAGYVVPSYVMLVPMLLLLPPLTVPLFSAVGLVIASAVRWASKRGSAEHVLVSIPNAWHALGPALVLALVGPIHGVLSTTTVYLAAFLAGCFLDLGTSMLREAAALGVAPQLQLRVVAVVWLIDACIAPIGLMLAHAARHDHIQLLTVLPLGALLLILDRDRSARIAQAQHRLELVGRERTRLQAAVRRLGDAFAAKLDLPAITSIVLHGSVEALDADAGRVTLEVANRPALIDTAGNGDLVELLAAVGETAHTSGRAGQLERDGVWALALPFGLGSDGRPALGTLTVARRTREFRPDEQSLMMGLVERAHTAVREILHHESLREQALTDPLTGLGNRRKLSSDLNDRLARAAIATAEPLVLMLFDLDGFKSYNDTFGHLAGDALLARLGGKLAAAVVPHGAAYRLGGDEFCALLPARRGELHEMVGRTASALCESGETFSVGASCGAVLLPHEASTPEYALQLADERMYARKQGRPSAVTEQTRDVLVRIMHAKQPELPDHSTGVARLATLVGRRLGMNAEQLDELGRAAELHDIGKVGIPDAILEKPGELDDAEWEFIRQHTILGERILSAAPALRPVATIVRASHERWDGRGYPDGLSGDDIPLAARIVSVCDAYEAITGDRCYRGARPAELAREELRREAGHQFDPVVVEAFLAELDEPPIDSSPGPTADEEAAWQLAEEVATTFGEMLDLPS
jgi:diguanylate cyclase (GGDEF)-like protein